VSTPAALAKTTFYMGGKSFIGPEIFKAVPGLESTIENLRDTSQLGFSNE
jgi:hypothetical protein